MGEQTDARGNRNAQSTGLDQLQHLGAETAGTTLQIQSIENQTGRNGDVTPFRSIAGIGLKRGSLLQQPLTIGGPAMTRGCLPLFWSQRCESG